MDIFLVGKRSKKLIFVFKLPDSSWRKKKESSALPIFIGNSNSVWLQGNVLTLLSLHHERVELMPLWPFWSAVVVVFVDKWLLLDPLAGGILSPVIFEVVGSLLWEKEPEKCRMIAVYLMITWHSLRHDPVLTVTLMTADCDDDGWHASYIRVDQGQQRDTGRHSPGLQSHCPPRGASSGGLP